jgi:hypothetical protein
MRNGPYQYLRPNQVLWGERAKRARLAELAGLGPGELAGLAGLVRRGRRGLRGGDSGCSLVRGRIGTDGMGNVPSV